MFAASVLRQLQSPRTLRLWNRKGQPRVTWPLGGRSRPLGLCRTRGWMAWADSSDGKNSELRCWRLSPLGATGPAADGHAWTNGTRRTARGTPRVPRLRLKHIACAFEVQPKLTHSSEEIFSDIEYLSRSQVPAAATRHRSSRLGDLPHRSVSVSDPCPPMPRTRATFYHLLLTFSPTLRSRPSARPGGISVTCGRHPIVVYVHAYLAVQPCSGGAGATRCLSAPPICFYDSVFASARTFSKARSDDSLVSAS